MIETRPITSRAEWLEWRKTVLTASDVGAASGIDEYRSKLSVYADKMEGIVLDETPIMRRGRLFEAAAVEYIREEHPDWEIERPAAFYIDVDLKLGATPDLIAMAPDRGKINIQIKTVSAPTFERWDGQPPKSYLLQTVTENLLTGANEGILAVLVVSAYSAELHEFPVPRHPAAERRVCDLARDFWKNVRAGLIPAPDYERDAELVDQLYPPDSTKPVPLDLSTDNRLGAVLDLREACKEKIKAAEERVKELDAEIVHKLDGAVLATLPGWKITHKTTHRGEYFVPAKDFPVLRVSRIDTEEGPQ